MPDFEVPDVVRKHPAIVVGSVLAGSLLLYVWWTRDSGSTGAVGNSGPSAAQLQYGLQSAQIQAGAASQASSQDFQLSAKKLDISAQSDTLQAQYNLALAGLTEKQSEATTAATLQTHSIDQQFAASLAQLQERGAENAASLTIALQQSADAREERLATTAATVTLGLNSTATQEHLAKIVADEQTSIASANAETTKTIAGLNAAIAGYQIQSTDYIAGINAYTSQFATLQSANVNITQSNNSANVAIRQTEAAVEIAKANASGKSDSSMWGAIAGVALALI